MIVQDKFNTNVEHGILMPQGKEKKKDEGKKKKKEIKLELKSPKEVLDSLALDNVVELVPNFAYRGVRGNTYVLVEPKIPDEIFPELMRIGKEYVLLRIDLSKREKMDVIYEQAAKRAIKELKLKENEMLKNFLVYYLYRDIEGYGPIDPLMHDPYIEDITLPARGSRYVYVYVADLATWLRTEIELQEEEARRIVLKFAEHVGKQVSLAKPRLEGRLPDGSRVHALFGSAASGGGTIFTVRRFVRRPGIEDLIRSGALSIEAAAYLWLLIEHGMSGFIVGETGSGKTTLLNVLLSLLPRQAHIVTVEDTQEIYLPYHGNWTSLLGQPPGMGEKGLEIPDLLRDVLRMRPDYVVVGESRGEETRLLIQFINLGHTSLTTFHSNTLEGLIQRLKSDPINLTAEQIASFKVAVLTRREGTFRGVVRIAEILFDPIRNDVTLHDVFVRKMEGLVGDPLKNSKLMEEIRIKHNIPIEALYEEYLEKASELERRISKEVARVEPV
jgi:flagellar protein FlaI